MKMRKLASIGTACMLLLAGCGGWYEPVDKDTVMAHKIGPAQAKKRLAYPGTLAEDTVKTLSVKAVNTYFGADLTLEDTRIELETFDPDQVRSWLKELKGDEALLDDEYNTQLSDLPSGVNTAILINRHDPSIHYIVSLNASDGDILALRQYSGYRSGSTGGGALGKHKAGAIARQFLERGGAVNWSELEWREYPVNGEEYTLLCYRHKQTRVIKYIVGIDTRTKEVFSFSKDIMAVTSYFLQVISNPTYSMPT
ncbi:hypothetical protein [Paenibacillus apiarius]|uniref:hypothetical protein n=1 Tax=Paenibacillus apiarius TaxID=46240 RepID=UPI001980A9D1|nr:hypothetical protein [Paenibacillus apiarius]MBN3523670.1 hypothetical protein [Paenibacillus apiarius]